MSRDQPAALRPPMPHEHESILGPPMGPMILVDGRSIETPHGEAGGFEEFLRANRIISNAGIVR